jgi:hypothetical protein
MLLVTSYYFIEFMKQISLILSLLSILSLVSCAREPMLQTNTSEEFSESIEQLISSDANNLHKDRLRAVFAVALSTNDFESLSQEKINEFKNLKFSEFREIMIDLAVGRFSDIRSLHEERLNSLNSDIATSRVELSGLQLTVDSARKLDKKDVTHFKYLTDNLERINGKIDTKCKEVKGSKSVDFEITNNSEFDFYVGQIYGNGDYFRQGMLVVNDLAYASLESGSSIRIPTMDLALVGVCNNSLRSFSYELLTAIGDKRDMETVLNRSVWLPREWSKTLLKVKADAETLDEKIESQAKLVVESEDMIETSKRGIQAIGTMQLQLLMSDYE